MLRKNFDISVVWKKSTENLNIVLHIVPWNLTSHTLKQNHFFINKDPQSTEIRNTNQMVFKNCYFNNDIVAIASLVSLTTHLGFLDPKANYFLKNACRLSSVFCLGIQSRSKTLFRSSFSS